jgi:GTP pyrophosphokinase
MDEIAERGFAAHWKYKEMDTSTQENELDKWIRRVREMLENPQENALEFLDEFKLNLFTSEIIVFTPKGETRSLPKGATAVDFAYEIHTEIGNKAIGAKVNHKLVPLSYKLSSGDQVEIITAASQKPTWGLLDFATTARAKAAIKNALKGEVKNRIEKGQQLLEAKLLEMGIQPSSRVLKKILPVYEVSSKDELYTKNWFGAGKPHNLKKIFKKNTQNKWIKILEVTNRAWIKKVEADEETSTGSI